MNNMTSLEFYNLIKVNPSPEIWLKSRKVKIRMLNALMNNIKNSLNHAKITFHKYQLSKDSTRIFFFFNNEDIKKASEVIKKAFGVYSFSPVLRTSNKLKNISERTIEVGERVLKKNDTFALRVKRSGFHDYSSQDVAIKIGQEVIDYFSQLSLKVNLSSPKKEIHIEIRGEFSYIFTDVIYTNWGGLPSEYTRKALCNDIGRLNDLLAAFLVMRRGCELYPIFFEVSETNGLLEKRLLNWKELGEYSLHLNLLIRKVNIVNILEKVKQTLDSDKYFCSICRLLRFDILYRLLNKLDLKKFSLIKAISDGTSLNNNTLCNDEVDLESIALNYMFSEYPIFTPVIGLGRNRGEILIKKISNNIEKLDYCQFKPQNQEIDIEEIKTLYKSLDLESLIEKSIDDIEEYNLF